MEAKFQTDEELRQKIEEFFKTEKAPTVTGLAYYLGFASRQSFYDYEKNERHSYTIKRARLFMESVYEKALSKGNCTGAIFALKNFGWSDKQEIEQNTTIKDERVDLAKLTDEELRILTEIQRKSGTSQA